MPRTKTRPGAHNLKEVWRAEDDWSDILTKEERRKRQNRLNQRVYRKRHTQEESSSTGRVPFRVGRFRISAVPTPAKPEDSRSKAIPITSEVQHSTKSAAKSRDLNVSETLTHSGPPIAKQNPTAFDALFPYVGKVNFESTESEIQAQDHTASNSLFSNTLSLPGSNEGSPCFQSERLSDPFPLSTDHLMHLIHQNVYRALIANKSILSTTASQFKIDLDIPIPVSQNLCDGLTVIHHKPEQYLPNSLEPTFIQKNIAHSSWINMFPFPKLRDNLIEHERDFDHGNLFSDVFGDLFRNGTPSHDQLGHVSYSSSSISPDIDPWEELSDEFTTRRTGFIVWGESWDIESWEVTPAFLKKWGWLLKGCEELIVYTNRWRAKRYEQPLVLSGHCEMSNITSSSCLQMVDKIAVPDGRLL